MANPTPYEVSYNFANFQSNNPDDPLPGVQVDNELAGVETAIADLIDALADVRRSDGGLKNGSVTLDSMSLGVIAALTDLDAESSAEIDAAVALVQSNLEADLAAGLALKSDLGHTHAASTITVSTIAGIVGTTVQAALAELRALGPQTGALYLTIDPTDKPGWVPCNDGTIGDAASGATTRAHADVATLYSLVWNVVPDAFAPVNTGRGVSATADFAAHKPMALTKMMGRLLAIAGAGSGLTSRAIGEFLGAETVALAQANFPDVALPVTDPQHTHPIANANQNGGTGAGTGVTHSAGTLTATGSAATGISVRTGGSGTPVNKMPPTGFVQAFLKL